MHIYSLLIWVPLSWSVSSPMLVIDVADVERSRLARAVPRRFGVGDLSRVDPADGSRFRNRTRQSDRASGRKLRGQASLVRCKARGCRDGAAAGEPITTTPSFAATVTRNARWVRVADDRTRSRRDLGPE